MGLPYNFFGGEGTIETVNKVDVNDDYVELNVSYFGLGATMRSNYGTNGTMNSAELIAHEIGHNLHPAPHPNTDGTYESYPSSGIGSNKTGLTPSKEETKKIVNSSRHTVPTTPPR